MFENLNIPYKFRTAAYNGKDYFESTRHLIANAPTEYFDSSEETNMAIGALDYMTMNWDNPIYAR